MTIQDRRAELDRKAHIKQETTIEILTLFTVQDTWVGGWDECSTADLTTCQDDDQCVRVVQRYLYFIFYLILTQITSQ